MLTFRGSWKAKYGDPMTEYVNRDGGPSKVALTVSTGVPTKKKNGLINTELETVLINSGHTCCHVFPDIQNVSAVLEHRPRPAGSGNNPNLQLCLAVPGDCAVIAD